MFLRSSMLLLSHRKPPSQHLGIFIQSAIDKVNEHIMDSEYGREQLASDLCISGSTLYNKLRAITGQNVSSFITSIRMKQACQILKQNPYIRINELSYQVGFSTPRYFSQCFKKEFGLGVKEYIEKEGLAAKE